MTQAQQNQNNIDDWAAKGSGEDPEVRRLMDDPAAISELLRENATLKEAIAKSPVACCVYDSDDTLIAHNHTYYDLYAQHFSIARAMAEGKRLTYADLVRASLSGNVPTEQLEAAVKSRVDAQRNADGTPVERDYGHQGIFRVVKYPLSDGSVAGMAIDVSELKAREAELTQARIKAEKMERVKSDFLANMSHELRTPLNAVIGFSELTHMMLDAEAFEKEREYLCHIADSGKHLVSLIDDLLDLSKIEANAQKLEESVFCVTTLLREAHVMLTPQALEKDMQLNLGECPPELKIKGDERAIKQIVLNLGTNALRYTPMGGSVTLGGKINASGEVVISVEDNGDGIPENDLQRIQAPFVRAKAQEKAASAGVGLGLSIVKGLARLHGGQFQMSSVVGEGTRAELILPVERMISVAGVPVSGISLEDLSENCASER